MILAYLDDRTLCIYDSPEEVPGDIEPLVVNEALVAAYDETGIKYRVEWIKKNKRHKILGSITAEKNGDYRIVPTEVRDKRALLNIINEAIEIHPSSAEATVKGLKQMLSDL